MNLIQNAIRFPITTTVGVLFLVLFGVIALFRVPIQLIPSVEQPEISILTVWPGASPQEIEREITDRQEEQLKSVSGLVKMESESTDGQATVNLTFLTGTDLDTALIRVSNALEQVPSYPLDAEKPVISTVNANNSPIAWFILEPDPEHPQPFEGDVSTLFNLVDNAVKPELERVPGVAAANTFGGREMEMQVIVDPAKLAARGVTISQLAAALDRENDNISGGDFPEGKRRYVVRVLGAYESEEEVADVVVAVRGGSPIYVRDVAEVRLGYQKAVANAYHEGQRVMALNCVRETGANVLEVMERLKVSVDRINKDLFAPRGLRLIQVYDETEYINGAIDLVQQSLLLGGFLAIVVLLLFLRSISSTLVVATAIPISVIGAFLMMNLFGRTINVVSLAGMAFAVGMVVDNSIVVLENIYRHRQMGHSRSQSAHLGAREVWGAVLASTLTTIAVFLPVLFVKEEAGQLFRDIAIAISCAVALSLIVAITAIPSLSARILEVSSSHKAGADNGKRGPAARLRDGIADAVHWICGGLFRRLFVVAGMTGGALLLTWALFPQTEYLPSGNQNLMFGIILPPPGYNIEQTSEIRHLYSRELRHLWEADPEDPATAKMPGGGIQDFFYVALPNQAFMGGSANDQLRVRELTPEFFKANVQIPGSFAFTTQFSIFQGAADEGRAIDVEITGPDLMELIRLGQIVIGQVMTLMPNAQARPIPSLDLGNPELQLEPDRRRLAELGITNRDLGLAVNALVDGAKVSDYVYNGEEIDLKIIGEPNALQSTHRLDQLPIATPGGELAALGSVARMTLGNGPVQVNRIDRQRAITIRVGPSEDMPLQTAMEIIQNQILDPLGAEGQMSELYQATLSGSADKLTQTGEALKWNLILAVVITFLLLSALFESFLYPFVILFTVPLAALGGFLGMRAVGIPSMDVLTMLGFIILIGTVVNNAILIVHQSLIYIRDEGRADRDAIREATRNRIRPIFMSVCTSVFGMLPLVLFPGAGSELYRGLGSVVVGGLVLSTVFTLFLTPSLLSLSLDARRFLARTFSFLAEKPAATAED